VLAVSLPGPEGPQAVASDVADPAAAVAHAAFAAVAAQESVSLTAAQPTAAVTPEWAEDATRELGKIPFFVRGKARRNTERFALERGLGRITRDVLYEAKAHYGR
jgi:light-independent protochlorophyllide reductase subunit B